ncbi:hypothetical protein JCM19294_1558 [Nonlabens tegetincola]|uniref:Uncharacterized protein n=1 Tax=Nonlabens tegetincola TaxID=323273 RepID=A0A090QR45_9FLAO|nr:hypothetical protein JCM19294_1558 [Nonlabens tegetincola]
MTSAINGPATYQATVHKSNASIKNFYANITLSRKRNSNKSYSIT